MPYLLNKPKQPSNTFLLNMQANNTAYRNEKFHFTLPKVRQEINSYPDIFVWLYERAREPRRFYSPVIFYVISTLYSANAMYKTV